MAKTVEQFEAIADKLRADATVLHEELKNTVERLGNNVKDLHTNVKELDAKGRRLHKWAICLGVIGASIAGGAFYLESRMDSTVKNISASLSTQYIATWPEHLDNTKLLFADATQDDEILIRTDMIGYGSYTAPKRYDDYVQGLIKALANRAKVKILVHDQSYVRAALERQFHGNGPLQFGEDAKDYRDEQAFHAFVDFYSGGNTNLPGKAPIKGEPKTFEELRNAIISVGNYSCRKLMGAGAEIYMIPEVKTSSGNSVEYGTTYFWMMRNHKNPNSSEKKMVFAYPRFSSAETGYAFETRDEKLKAQFDGEFTKTSTTARPLTQSDCE